MDVTIFERIHLIKQDQQKSPWLNHVFVVFLKVFLCDTKVVCLTI